MGKSESRAKAQTTCRSPLPSSLRLFPNELHKHRLNVAYGLKYLMGWRRRPRIRRGRMRGLHRGKHMLVPRRQSVGIGWRSIWITEDLRAKRIGYLRNLPGMHGIP